MAGPTPVQHQTTLEDWSNDGDFDFDEDDMPTNLPSAPIPKPHLNVTLSNGRTVQMLSANVHPNNPNSEPRITYGLVGEDSRDGIVATSSSGSAFANRTKYADMEDLDMMDDDNDEYPTIKGFETRTSSSTAGQVSGRSTVRAQVTGTALNGRAYITRLGSTGSRSNVRQQDSEMFEDLDWGNKVEQASSSRSAAADLKNKLNLRLAKQHDDIPNKEDNWDDYEAGFGSDADDDSRQTTLKAGTVTYKNIAGSASLGHSPVPRGNPVGEDENMEDGFQLPLTLQHLKLITRSPQSSPVLRHRSSRSSLASATTGQTSDWDNIGTPGNARMRVQGSTSGTSSRASSAVIPGTDQSEVEEQHALNHAEHGTGMDDDLEEGLELPVPSFFSSGRTRELNRLLDQKRKPGLSRESPSNEQVRSPSGTFKPSSTLMKPTLSSVAKLKYVPLAQDQLEDQLEDGLVLQDERTELTHGRLARIRQSRAATGTPTGPRNAAGGTLKRGFITGRQRVNATAQKGDTLSRQYNPSRSVSGTNGLLATPSNSRILQTTPSSPAQQAGPSSSGNTPSRLRHQKSHSRLGHAPPSPSLGKRQSMSSIREMAQLHETTGYSTYYPPIAHVPSYSAQTAASAARAAGTIRKNSTESDEWASRTPSRTPSERSLAPRSTSSTANSRTGRTRGPIPSSFTHDAVVDKSSFPAPLALPGSSSRFRKTTAVRSYGDGTELDEIEDLQVDRAKEGMVKLPTSTGRSAGGSLGRSAGQHLGLGRPPRLNPSLVETTAANVTAEKRKQHPAEPVPAPRQAATSKGKPIARKAGLIRHLGKVEKKKVGEMTWNPETLRWEGNYQVLRDFDAQVLSSARPALITHYAAFASMKATSSRSTVASGQGEVKGTTVEQAAPPPLNAARVVGNMMFDPDKMCWVSTLSAEEDEPDPFAGIDDDDDDDDDDFSDRLSTRHGSGFGDQEDDQFGEYDDLRGGTITRDTGRTLMDGIRSRVTPGPGLMRFSSATTTSSLSSAGTGTTHDSEMEGGSAFGLVRDKHRGEGWSGEAGTLRRGQLRQTSTLKPGQREYSTQTDSGFKVNRPTTYVSEQLWQQSLAAEARHEREMLGWRVDRVGWGTREAEREREREKRREEKRLWEIRNLAMRS